MFLCVYVIVFRVTSLLDLSSPIGRPARPGRDAVVASQRARLLRALIVVVARKGYASTVVSDVVAEAGVSRKTFYEQFPNLLGCFLAAYEACLELLREHVLAARDPALEPAVQIRRIVDAYLDLMVEQPHLARTYLVESYAAGDEAIARRQHTLTEFALLLAGLHGEMLAKDSAGSDALSEVGYEVVVNSVIAMVTSRVAQRRTHELPSLAPTLTAHVLRGLGLEDP